MAKQQKSTKAKKQPKAKVTSEQADKLAEHCEAILTHTSAVIRMLKDTGGYQSVIDQLTHQYNRNERLQNRFIIQADTEEAERIKVQRNLEKYKQKAAELGLDQ